MRRLPAGPLRTHKQGERGLRTKVRPHDFSEGSEGPDGWEAGVLSSGTGPSDFSLQAVGPPKCSGQGQMAEGGDGRAWQCGPAGLPGEGPGHGTGCVELHQASGVPSPPRHLVRPATGPLLSLGLSV